MERICIVSIETNDCISLSFGNRVLVHKENTVQFCPLKDEFYFRDKRQGDDRLVGDYK